MCVRGIRSVRGQAFVTIIPVARHVEKAKFALVDRVMTTAMHVRSAKRNKFVSIASVMRRVRHVRSANRRKYAKIASVMMQTIRV